jgi:hypothetical protein
MKSYLQILLCSLVFTAALSAQDLGPHDINGQGCFGCHSSSDVDPNNVAATFLWGDFMSATYPTYGGGVLTVGPGLTDQDPAFHSAACLVCHDGNTATLSSSHPVNIPYRVGTHGWWPGTVTSSGVNFTPSNFDATYAHSVRFYVSGGVAYIECATCHDPHHYSTATVTINGKIVTKPTAHFIRGWYDDTNPTSNSAAQFCRSCHSDQQ